MIKEAAETIIELKTALDQIQSGALNVMDGQLRLSNNVWVNGIIKTVEIARAEEAFLIAANVLISGGDVVHFATKSEEQREREYQHALTELRAYNKVLEYARLRPEVEQMGTADGSEVDAPEI